MGKQPITEQYLISAIEGCKRILLIEPPYPRKYPPLSLAKISTFCKERGIHVDYSRNMVYEKYDLILITTLFTYYSNVVKDVINSRGLFHRNTPTIVGGIFASIIPTFFDQFTNLDVYTGYSKVLDQCIPDRAIMDTADEPWNEFSWVFTSRGCANKCGYCCVWRIEKERWTNKDWRDHIFPDKPNILICDNNLSAVSYDHMKSVIDFANSKDKAIMFEGGVDVKFIDNDAAKLLSTAKYARHGLRMAFDRIEEDGVFQAAVQRLIDTGMNIESNVEAFLLFNFDDNPRDAYYRGREAYMLGIHQVYPMFYRQLTSLTKDNPFIGKHWTYNLARAFRNYWLQRRWFKYFAFEAYLHLPETIRAYNLTEEDFEKWHSPTVPFHQIKKRVLKR